MFCRSLPSVHQQFLYDNGGTPSDLSDDTVTFIGGKAAPIIA